MRNINSLFLILLAITYSSLKASEKNSSENVKEKNSDRPNIIFILTDDQRWDAIGYAKNKLAFTPQMDKLAKQGVFFKNTIATTPICSASRASIFSGMQERTHKYSFQTADIKDEYMQNAFPKLLRASGYHTAMFGKFGVSYNHLDMLFDEYEKYDLRYSKKDRSSYYYKTIDKDTVHLTRYTGQKALDFLDRAPQKKPFCLQLSFSAPHASDNTKEQYFWQEPSNHVLKNQTVPDASLGEQKYYDALPQIVKDGFNRFRWGWRYDTPEKYQHSVKGYYRMIAGIDYEIEKIRKKLKEKDLDKNTVIILMGDNGQFLGERQMAGKWLMYDNSIKVPLIIFDPRAKKQHKDVEEMALNVDIPATILDLAHVERPTTWHGKSLMPFINNKKASLGRNAVLIEHLWEFQKIPPSEGVRTNKWKYFRYINDKSIEELYDLEKDPKEINNLAYDQNHKETLSELKNTLAKLIEEHKDPYSSIPRKLGVNFNTNQNPIVSDFKSLKFGWELPAIAGYQSAYEILVSSSKEKLENNNGDLWDSGQVRGKKSSNILYKGKKLSDKTSYFWKVRIWDADNRLSDYAAFETFNTNTEKTEHSKTIWDKASYEFTCADPVLQKSWNTSVSETQKNSSFKEGNLSPMEALRYQIASYALSSNYDAVRTLIHAQCNNLSSIPEEVFYIASMLQNDYNYTGNIELIEKYYPSLIKACTKSQLKKNNLYANAAKQQTTLSNIYFAKNTEFISNFANLLGKENDVLKYNMLGTVIEQTIQEKFVDTKGLFKTSLKDTKNSTSVNAIALAFHLVTKKNAPKVLAYLDQNKNNIDSNDLPFLLEALLDTSELELAYDILKKNETSQNIASIPVAFISRNAWGIQPKSSGYDVAAIRPKLGALKSSTIKIPTNKGPIKASYEYLSFRKQIYAIDLPPNMVGEFEMLFSQEHIVKVNGVKTDTSFGTIRLTPGLNTVELIINTF